MADYMMVLSGDRDDLALSLMCSIYSIGEEYGEPGCPIFHPERGDTGQKRRLALMTMAGVYREAGRMAGGEPEGEYRFVFPRPRLECPSSYGQREPVIKASFWRTNKGGHEVGLKFSAHTREEVEYLVGAVKDWADGRIVEERDFGL